MEFAQVLRERRASRRLSQLELALRVGTTQRHLSFIETGRSAPVDVTVSELKLEAFLPADAATAAALHAATPRRADETVSPSG